MCAKLIVVTAFTTPIKNESPSLQHAIAVSNIIDVVAYANSEYPSVNSAITAAIPVDNSIQTGQYLVAESLSAVVDAANDPDP